MKDLYPEIEEYRKVSSRIDKQLHDLQKEKQKRKRELMEIEREYDQMIIDEATLGIAVDKVKLNKLSDRKKNIDRDLSQFDDRITTIENRREEILADYLPALHEGYKREVKKINEEIQGKMKGIIPAALPYLEYLVEIGQLRRKRTMLHNSLIAEAKKADRDFENKHYRFGMGERAGTKLFDDDYSGNSWGYGLSVDEQKTVVSTGGLPYRHALYKLTKEIEPRYFEAKRKVEQVLQEREGK